MSIVHAKSVMFVINYFLVYYFISRPTSGAVLFRAIGTVDLINLMISGTFENITYLQVHIKLTIIYKLSFQPMITIIT